MKLLAFAASNSSSSINRTLVEHAVKRYLAEFNPEVDVEFLDLNDFELPIYSIDRENENGVPTPARQFFDKIGAADALLVSFAEHNGSVTAAWKNIFDWMSRIDMKVWHDKPMVIMAASPGPRAGAGALANQTSMAPFFGGNIKASVGIGKWSEAFDHATNTLTQASDIAALGAALATLDPD